MGHDAVHLGDGDRFADEAYGHGADDRFLHRDGLELNVQQLPRARIALNLLHECRLGATVKSNADNAGAPTMREQMLERACGSLNRARVAMAVDAGGEYPP